MTMVRFCLNNAGPQREGVGESVGALGNRQAEPVSASVSVEDPESEDPESSSKRPSPSEGVGGH